MGPKKSNTKNGKGGKRKTGSFKVRSTSKVKAVADAKAKAKHQVEVDKAGMNKAAELVEAELKSWSKKVRANQRARYNGPKLVSMELTGVKWHNADAIRLNIKFEKFTISIPFGISQNTNHTIYRRKWEALTSMFSYIGFGKATFKPKTFLNDFADNAPRF